jgi:hypothetical protein
MMSLRQKYHFPITFTICQSQLVRFTGKIA